MNRQTTVTLVLLPGMDGTGELFEPIVAAVGQRFPVKIIRYPASEPLGYPELESVVRSSLPTDGPFVVLGESFSGPIAVAVAASHPNGLIGLVLCCTFVRNPRPRLRPLSFLIDALPTGSLFARGAGVALLGRFSTPELRQMFLRAVAKVAPATFRARLRSVLEVDVTNELAAVQVPILYVRAVADSVVPAGAAELVKSIQPKLKLVDVRAPHFLLQVEPGKAADLIGEFVDAICHP
ncbi:alpha/beta fold hydrolase [Dyella sp. Tek66A03]|uniref:alpha/beta fold hydrolase n=1 Tax=Dyella sp. Tek66A03 TaxID=3458298 RepID=UPI00403ED8C5